MPDQAPDTRPESVSVREFFDSFRDMLQMELLAGEEGLDNVIAESRAVLMHRNEMGSFFLLQSVIYHLDNKKIYYQDNSNGLLGQRKEFELYNGSIVPGMHILSVEMVYRGNSSLFSYLEGYVFKLRSKCEFYAQREIGRAHV